MQKAMICAAAFAAILVGGASIDNTKANELVVNAVCVTSDGVVDAHPIAFYDDGTCINGLFRTGITLSDGD